MATFMEMFADIEANAGNSRVLDPEAVQAGLQDLGQVRNDSDKDDERRGGPPGFNGSGGIKAVGDPEIVDASGRYFHYLGPALIVSFDRRGVVRSLEFIGVKGGKRDANYISEVWHYDIRTQKYKYRNLWYNQGVPAHACKDGQAPRADAYWGESWSWRGDGEEFYVGDPSWKSERPVHEKPPPHFLSAFKATSETFFVNLEERSFARGPRYGMLMDVIHDPERFLKPLIRSCSKAPAVWMKGTASAITQTKQNDRKPGKVLMPERKEQAVQVAQLVFGLAACVQPSSVASSSATSTFQGAPRTASSSTYRPECDDPWLCSDPWSASKALSAL